MSHCIACGLLLARRSKYCGACGAAQAAAEPRLALPDPRPDAGAGHEIRFLLVFYGFCLLQSVAAQVQIALGGDPFSAELVYTLVFGTVTLGFAWRAPELSWTPLGHAGCGWRGYLAMTLISLPILGLVGGYVDGLTAWFGVQVPGELEGYADHSLLWPLLLLAVTAPLFEEIAFRGLIFGGLRRSLTVWESLLVSAFAFAMVHLAVPSLVTHLPLGLYFGWLRHRTGSLWPPIYAHACHNVGVFVWEWQRMG